MAGSNGSFIAGGDIRPCRIVKMDTTASEPFQVKEADANEFGIGVSQEGTRLAPGVSGSTANAGEDTYQVRVFGPGEQPLLELGSGGITQGDLIKSDADGKGVAVATTGTTIQNYIGWALEDGAENEKVRIFVHPGKTRPALA